MSPSRSGETWRDVVVVGAGVVGAAIARELAHYDIDVALVEIVPRGPSYGVNLVRFATVPFAADVERRLRAAVAPVATIRAGGPYFRSHAARAAS